MNEEESSSPNLQTIPEFTSRGSQLGTMPRVQCTLNIFTGYAKWVRLESTLWGGLLIDSTELTLTSSLFIPNPLGGTTQSLQLMGVIFLYFFRWMGNSLPWKRGGGGIHHSIEELIKFRLREFIQKDLSLLPISVGAALKMEGVKDG